jgi:hypothetical protein
LVAEEVDMDNLDETNEKLFQALGRAVSKIWSNLPKEVQHHLFEEAISSEDDAMRQRLAVFLHDKHSRTTDSIKARAILEPDSLGG